MTAERDAADEDRQRVGVTERPHPGPELAPRVVALGGGPGELGQLSDHHVDGRACEKARDHSLREKAGDPPKTQQRDQQEQDARDQGDRRDQLRCLISADAADRHGTPRDGRERGARPGRDVPGGAEERVDDPSGGGCVQAVLERDAGDVGVAQVLRDDEGGDRDTRGEVPAQAATVVLRQPAGHREDPPQIRHDRQSSRSAARRPARAASSSSAWSRSFWSGGRRSGVGFQSA